MQEAEARWHEGLASEEEFWHRWIATAGDQWPDDFARRLQRRPLEPIETECLRRSPGDTATMIDVGAGPLTVLGTDHPTKSVEIVAVDPLADRYDELLAAANIEPPVRTQLCAGEKLLERFGPDSFDVAHARNAPDHTYDPIAVINNMLAVVRPGGFVILHHWVNEGERESYAGLHQWNLDARRGRFVIWRPGERRRDVARGLTVQAHVWVRKRDEWLVCVLQRAPRQASVATRLRQPLRDASFGRFLNRTLRPTS